MNEPSGAPAAPPAPAGEVSIVRVRVSELEEFARRNGEEAGRGGVVAISPERARAQARNPYADPDDVALVAAYVDGRCEGYVGVLPGLMWDGARTRKVNSITTWYASPEMRGKKVGFRVLDAARDAGYDLFTTVFTESAARVFRTSMREMPALTYRLVDLRRGVPWSLVFRKLAGTGEGTLPRVERGVFRPARAVLLALLAARYAGAAARLRAREVQGLDEADFAPLEADPTPRFVRGAPVVNWMLANPWITETPPPPDDPWRGYYFSRTRPLFRYAAWRFHDERGGRAGFAVVSVTDHNGQRSVRLLDHELRAPADPDALLGLVLQYARRWGADVMVLPESMAPALRGPVWRLLSRPAVRPYFCNLREPEGDMAGLLGRLRLDRCDCDVAFI